jgi:hypothetical protein
MLQARQRMTRKSEARGATWPESPSPRGGNKGGNTMTKKSFPRVRSTVKAGGVTVNNHNQRALKVRTAVKAGGMEAKNHNQRVR